MKSHDHRLRQPKATTGSADTQTAFNTPWTLHFDRDGTEDVAIINDADGRELVTSRQFWLPDGNDPVPPTLASIWLMKAAPKLYRALEYLLEQTIDPELKHRIALSKCVEDARLRARAALAEAQGKMDSPTRASVPLPIIIEVRGGVVQEVLNIPPGVAYEIIDHDDREEQEALQETDSTPLPPDPDELNDDRACWAGKSVRAFQEATGTDDGDVLCDLLADLMHWSDRNKYDFTAALIHARDYYQAETR